MSEPFIRIVLQFYSSTGRLLKSSELDLRAQRKLYLLKWYIKDCLGWDGTIYFKQNNIDYKNSSSLSDLAVGNNDTLQLKRASKKNPALLQNCVIYTSPEECKEINVPVNNSTVEHLKFLIECTEKILVENQNFEISTGRLSDTKKITKKEAAELVITDVSKRPSSPSKPLNFKSLGREPAQNALQSTLKDFKKDCGESPKSSPETTKKNSDQESSDDDTDSNDGTRGSEGCALPKNSRHLYNRTKSLQTDNIKYAFPDCNGVIVSMEGKKLKQKGTGENCLVASSSPPSEQKLFSVSESDK